MAKTCYGCMQEKNASPICEHCGFDERSRNDRHQLPMGIVIHQQYVVGRVLGQGGFGITYMGWDLLLNIPVAIKEFYPGGLVSRDCSAQTEVKCYSDSQEIFIDSKSRFLREAQALARFINIPQIVQVQGFFEENGTAYIIMEYIQGMDLRKHIRNKGRCPSAEEILELMEPVMAALKEVHKSGLIHRDISPDNIMLLSNGNVKLLDFGAVREVHNPDVDKELTHATQAILKHGFAPLEQYQAKGKLGPWTDVYALCATIYYCLTGRVPPEAHDRMMEGDNLDWDGIPGLTERQKATLIKGMALMPKDRITSVQELYDGLYQVQAATPEVQQGTITDWQETPEEISAEETDNQETNAEVTEAAVQEVADNENVHKAGKQHPLLWAASLIALFYTGRFMLAEAAFSYHYSDVTDFLFVSSLVVFAVLSVLVPVVEYLTRKKRKPGAFILLAALIVGFAWVVWMLDDITGYTGSSLSYYPAWRCFLNLISMNLSMMALNLLDMETQRSVNMRCAIGFMTGAMFAGVAVEYIFGVTERIFYWYPHECILLVLAVNTPFLILHLSKNVGKIKAASKADKLMKLYPVILVVLSLMTAMALKNIMPPYLWQF
ncbi:MAG: protein kinase [Oscillospiraceae bacterium]|nr:protein kinase [Oscillospiraceae bacterium]